MDNRGNKIEFIIRDMTIPGDIWNNLCHFCVELFFDAMRNANPYLLSDGEGNLPLVSKDVIAVNGSGAHGFETLVLYRAPFHGYHPAVREKHFLGMSEEGLMDSVRTKGLAYKHVICGILRKAEEFDLISVVRPFDFQESLFYAKSDPLTAEEKSLACELFYRDCDMSQVVNEAVEQEQEVEETQNIVDIEVPYQDIELAFSDE